MKTFKDSAGHEWQVQINTNAIKRARDTAAVNLVDITGGDLYGKMLLDPVLVVDIAYGVCKPEADARKLTREDFNAAICGDAIADARTAILEDLVDFFPNPVRQGLKAAFDRAGASPPGDASGSSPAPAASTQGS